MRYLEEDGTIGRLYEHYFVTVGNATSVADSQKFGKAIAERLKKANVDGVILTSTWGTDTRCGATLAKEIDRVGDILHKTWQKKKQMVDTISNDEIEKMYQTAMDAGALGGKITGAGAGGFLLLYVRREKQDKVRTALANYRELPFFFEKHGSQIIFNYRSYPWKWLHYLIS